MGILVAELPSWVDSGTLETGSVLVAVGASILAIVAMISIREVATRFVTFGVLAAIAVGAGAYRANLNECAETCDCRFLGDPVPVDDCSTSAILPSAD